MIRNYFFTLVLVFVSIQLISQDFKSEDDLKEKAQELFENKKLIEASPLFAQLLSLYPEDPNYNYKYGACLLASSSDREKPLKYLKFAITKGSQVDPLAYYYLGKAHHLNYNFSEAVKYYNRFKTKGSSDEREEYQVERQIEMCKNGNQLLSKLNDVQVVEKQIIGKKDFYRIYDLEGIDGKILAKPEDFMTKYDQKVGEKSIMYLPNNASEVYFSSYGKKGENGKDIFKTVMLGNRSWSEPVNLGPSINTPFDEDYPFIHPDGRTLYFASKGHNSMGGYDLFMSVFDEATASWKAPINLDFAFSSVDDDILFVTDRDKVLAYFASTRANEADEITVYKVMVDKGPADISVIKGKYIAENNPNPHKATITVIDPNTKQTVGIYETDENGNYSIEIATNGGTYQFNLETTDDSPIHTGQVDIPRQDEFEVLGQELRLVGTGDQQQLVIKNIFDGSTAENNKGTGPQISSDLLRMKAQLDVNLSAEALADVGSKLNQKSNTIPDNSKQISSKPVVSDLNEASLRESLKETKLLYEANNGNLINAENYAFKEALDAKNRADSKFNEVEKLKANNTDLSIVEEAEREAEELAAKAAIATLIAENLKKENKESGISSRSFNSETLEIERNIENNNLESANNGIKNVSNRITSSPNALTFIQNQEEELNQREVINNQKLTELQSKTKELQGQRQDLISQIERLDSKIDNTSNEEEKTILFKEKEELNTDLNDINFRLTNTTEQYQNSLDVQLALNQEKQLYDIIEDKLSKNNKESISTISEREKEELINSLKQYREENKLAYFNNMNDDEATSNLNLDIPIRDADLATIEDKYNSQFNEASKIQAKDVSLAKKLNIYSNLIDELEESRNQIISEKDIITDQSERAKKSNEIASFDLVIQEKQREKAELEKEIEALALQSKSIDNQTALNSSNTTLNKNLNNSTSNSKKLSNQTTTAINGGSISTDNNSATQNEIDAIKIENIEDVEASSPVPTNLSAFSFNNSYGYLGDETKPELKKAKQTLYAASIASNKAQEERNAAYSLPTVEERKQAFENANKFEKQSKELQMKAVEEFSIVNNVEYTRNAQIITNANSYGENVESNNLDIALLLQDEAETYYESAREIRNALVNEKSNYKKEVELQKAYDFEMLALSKQREALKSLKLVDDDIAINETSKALNKYANIQTITDPDVLVISNASIAKAKGDSVLMYADNLDSSAVRIKRNAELLEIGKERDSLMALYSAKMDTVVSLRNKASVYYERQEQIQSGFAPTESITSGIIKPAIISENTISIEGINVDEEEQKVLMSSIEYINYRDLAIEKQKIVKNAQSEYNFAIELKKKQYQLQSEADIVLQSAAKTDDSSEKERRIKQAQILELKANKIDDSIDSLNRILKVKKYVITEADQKMNTAIANLLPTQQAKIVYLTSEQIEKSVLLSDGNMQFAEENETTVPVSNSSVIGKPADDDDVQKVQDNRVVVAQSQNTEMDKPILKDGTVNPNTIIRSRQNNNNTVSKEINNINPTRVRSKESSEAASFVQLGLNESAYDASNPIPPASNLPEGIVYKVQVGAFRNPIPQDLFKGFAPLNYENGPNGIKRYTAGIFLEENEAILARNAIRKIGYPDAFVVAFNNGERISVSAARNGNVDDTKSNAALNSSNSGNTQNKVLSDKFSSSDLEKVKAVGEIEDVYYTVQIGVFSKPVKKGALNSLGELTVFELPNGLIRYNAGIYSTAAEANEAKEAILKSIGDAFVTAYYKGRRFSLNEAARIQNQ